MSFVMNNFLNFFKLVSGVLLFKILFSAVRKILVKLSLDSAGIKSNQAVSINNQEFNKACFFARLHFFAFQLIILEMHFVFTQLIT